jgi:hypothetical protein
MPHASGLARFIVPSHFPGYELEVPPGEYLKLSSKKLLVGWRRYRVYIHCNIFTGPSEANSLYGVFGRHRAYGPPFSRKGRKAEFCPAGTVSLMGVYNATGRVVKFDNEVGLTERKHNGFNFLGVQEIAASRVGYIFQLIAKALFFGSQFAVIGVIHERMVWLSCRVGILAPRPGCVKHN